jgi:predicted phage tail component-like protein
VGKIDQKQGYQEFQGGKRLIFNGIEKENVNVADGFTLPTHSQIDFIMQSKHKYGSRITKKRLKELYIPVPVIVYPDSKSLDEMKIELNAWLHHKEDKKLIFKFFPNYFYYARLVNIDLQDYGNKVMKGVVKFVCGEIPFRIKEGEPLNLTQDFQSFVIHGQIESPWVSETVFSIPQSNFTLENDRGGKVVLNYNFIEGDTLKIDYDKRKVLLNDNNLATAITMETQWFELEIGDTQLRASHPTKMEYLELYY